MHILHVIGARPNFIKVAPVHAALAARGVRQTIVHTGQHYDAAMSDVFFQQLGLPEPDANLNIGSASHTVQTAEAMKRLEPVLHDARPDWVLVYGDVNSTLAAALVCAKSQVRFAHVEAGLRSHDRTMPEEINRMVTDRLADLLFTPSTDGDENLLAEGVPRDRIRFVGNVMIDTLVRLLPRARAVWPGLKQDLAVERFILLTLHRPSNVDDPEQLLPILRSLEDLARDVSIVFPVHPRTREKLRQLRFEPPPQVRMMAPLGYFEFLSLQENATVVITDSGGIQEETTYLGVPCLTLRENTERPVTVTIGTNKLLGRDVDALTREVSDALDGRGKRGALPPLWDGRTAERIADELLR